jgi:hypothetical protein
MSYYSQIVEYFSNKSVDKDLHTDVNYVNYNLNEVIDLFFKHDTLINIGTMIVAQVMCGLIIAFCSWLFRRPASPSTAVTQQKPATANATNNQQHQHNTHNYQVQTMQTPASARSTWSRIGSYLTPKRDKVSSPINNNQHTTIPSYNSAVIQAQQQQVHGGANQSILPPVQAENNPFDWSMDDNNPLPLIARASAPQLPAPDKFTRNTDPSNWLSKFELYMDLNKVENQNKARLLVFFLDDECTQCMKPTITAANSRDPEVAFDMLTEKIIAWFKPAKHSDAFERVKFSNREQREKEKYHFFMHSLINLAQKAYPQLNQEGREKLVIEQFIKGISNVHVRNELIRTFEDE